MAERAGVSVGTMYQYFSHKQALFYALNERYLDVLAEKVESACRARHGGSIEQMVEVLVTTYWDAKTERPEVTRALYRSVVELDNEALIDAFAQRVDVATAAMFASASGTVFTDLQTANPTLPTTIFGTVRSVYERNLPAAEGNTVLSQLVVMSNAYLKAVQVA